MKHHRAVIAITVATLFALAALAQAAAPQAEAKAPLAGEWHGSVTSGSSTMKIALSLTPANGKLVGALTSPHGSWSIAGVAEKDGVWTVTFNRPDGTTGSLSGKIASDKFAGDWSNAPMGTGTFELTKQEPGSEPRG